MRGSFLKYINICLFCLKGKDLSTVTVIYTDDDPTITLNDSVFCIGHLSKIVRTLFEAVIYGLKSCLTLIPDFVRGNWLLKL